jgi:CheY-like chemotaxis protein
VDDDPDNRDMLAASLEALGCTVVTARDGLDALGALARCPPPCLILLDVNMPRLDGAGFARALRADCQHCDLPIVSMSAGDDPLPIHAVLQHLAKPFRFDALGAAIEGACKDSSWLQQRRH